MSIKKQFLFIMILAITNCGFQPIHLEKNTQDFTINETTEEGNKNINKKILSKINLDKKNNSKKTKVIKKKTLCDFSLPKILA